MKFFRIIKKIIFWSLLFVVVILTAGIISSIIYKDRIIKQLIREANKHLNTPVRVDKIDLNIWDKFPQIAVSFNNILIEESFENSTSPLLTAQKVYIILNPFDLMRGEYVVNQIFIEHGEFFIKVDKNGKNNYAILMSGNDTREDSLTFDLRKIFLKDVSIHYFDARNNQEHSYHTRKQAASLTFEQNVYRIQTKGDLTCIFIKIDGRALFADKDFIINAMLTYSSGENRVEFQPSLFQLADSEFELEGSIDLSGETMLDLTISGIETNIRTLLSLLPEAQTRKYRDYKSQGEVYFDMTLTGSPNNAIALSSNFGLTNATVIYPESSTQFNDLNMKGTITINSVFKPEEGSAILENITGSVGGKSFSGNLSLENFTDPYLRFGFDGEIAISELLKLFPVEQLITASGTISGYVRFDGKISDLNSRYTAGKVSASGKLNLEDVVITFKDNYPPVTHVTGHFLFSKNDLVISNALVSVGNSNFEMKGTFKNILPYLLSGKRMIQIEASVYNALIDFDELLQTTEGKGVESRNFIISKNLQLDLDCRFNSLKFKRFVARNLEGEIKVKDQKAFVQNMTFESMGGQLSFNGLVNTSNGYIQITNSSHLKNINIDSLFYVFKNFNQSWLVADHLSGRIYADVLTDMTFSPGLRFYPDSLIADIRISISDGELNNFEPLIRLEKYIADKNLEHLRFSDLSNDIHIENRMIYVPAMEVRSNVTTIQISGTHTFEQKIDYHIVLPFESLGKSKNDEMFGAVEETGGGSKLHLRITGTTDDYEIVYDTKAVGKKIISDIKKEVQELKDAFRKKEVADGAQAILLNKDEFFEWEEEEDTIRVHYPQKKQ